MPVGGKKGSLFRGRDKSGIYEAGFQEGGKKEVGSGQGAHERGIYCSKSPVSERERRGEQGKSRRSDRDQMTNVHLCPQPHLKGGDHWGGDCRVPVYLQGGNRGGIERKTDRAVAEPSPKVGEGGCSLRSTLNAERERWGLKAANVGRKSYLFDWGRQKRGKGEFHDGRISSREKWKGNQRVTNTERSYRTVDGLTLWRRDAANEGKEAEEVPMFLHEEFSNKRNQFDWEKRELGLPCFRKKAEGLVKRAHFKRGRGRIG